MAEKMIVIDTSKCTACRACQTACKQWNSLSAVPTECDGSYENPPDLTYNTYTKIRFNEVADGDEITWFFGHHRCMHCNDAGCMKACPVPGASPASATEAASHDFLRMGPGRLGRPRAGRRLAIGGRAAVR